jgi:hypothetical protein
MNKRPALQFYPGDWWRANDIKGCSMSTQGVWFNLLMAMWDSPTQGKLETNLDSICRIIGAKTREVNAFFRENEQHKFADVTVCNGIVTITNRRMYCEFLERERTKERVKKHRLRKCNEDVTEENTPKCNANVTPPSSTSSSFSFKHIYIERQFSDLNIQAGLTVDECIACFHYYNKKGFVDKDGNKITSPLSALINWRINRPRFEGKTKLNKDIHKTKLFPIPGRTCGEKGCKLPAVYKHGGQAYDHYYCKLHMPGSVKEHYE